MAKNRELIATIDKALKNMEVKNTSSSKPYFRTALPSFDETTGKINFKLVDKQNVAIEGDDHAEGDTLTGTFRFGLRFYSKEADGTTNRKDPFYRWELLEEVDTAAEREEALFKAKLAQMKGATNKAGKELAENEAITDKW